MTRRESGLQPNLITVNDRAAVKMYKDGKDVTVDLALEDGDLRVVADENLTAALDGSKLYGTEEDGVAQDHERAAWVLRSRTLINGANGNVVVTEENERLYLAPASAPTSAAG